MEHIQHGCCFNRNRGAVVLQQDFYTRFNLSLVEDIVLFKQSDVLRMTKIRQSLRSRFQVQQAAFFCFFNPGISVAVAIEDDTLMCLIGFFNKIINCSLQVRSICQLSSELLQLFRYDSVEHNVRAGDGEHAAQHTELKLVAGEGERRGSVSVGVILNQSRDGVIAYFNVAFRIAVVYLIGSDGFKNCGQLRAQEHRNDSRRSFVSTQTMVIAGAGNRYTQQILVFINSLDDGCQEGQEAQVFIRLLARIQQVHALFSRQGPVVMLAAAVYAVEGFFMQQADQTMTQGYALHEFHH